MIGSVATAVFDIVLTAIGYTTELCAPPILRAAALLAVFDM